jgi:hypothetical protein
MSQQSKEANIIMAIQAMKRDPTLSSQRAATIYAVPETTLRRRTKGQPARREIRNGMLKLTSTEEESLVRYIIDLDSRGFGPRIDHVRDMANILLATCYALRVGKQWPYNFVKRCTELKTRFSRAYNFQRALCEDPDQINAWFRLVANMRTKYRIYNRNFYNFDKTGFMMGVICSSMVVTRADRRGRGKQLQAGNREWATTIEYVSSNGFVLLPFLIVQGVNYLTS